MANSAVQYLRLPVLASSGLAIVASSLLYFKQKCGLTLGVFFFLLLLLDIDLTLLVPDMITNPH